MTCLTCSKTLKSKRSRYCLKCAKARSRKFNRPPMKGPLTYQHGLKCGVCLVEIYSNYRHDYRTCLCTNWMTQVSVDGGHDYFKYGAGPKALFTICKRVKV